MAYIPNNPEAAAVYRGRVASFRTPGRAGTTGQKLFSIFNPAASGKVLVINGLTTDLYQTAVKSVGTAPPVVRIHRVTAEPTNGTVLTKILKDTLLTTSVASCRGDASADGTGSATTLTHATTNGTGTTLVTQEFAPRLLTAVGYEPFDRNDLLSDRNVILRPSEGLLLMLDYTLAAQNPITDMWIMGADWYETV